MIVILHLLCRYPQNKRSEGPASQKGRCTTEERVIVRTDNDYINIQIPRIQVSMVEMKLTTTNYSTARVCIDSATVTSGVVYHNLTDNKNSKSAVDPKHAIRQLNVPTDDNQDFILYYPVSRAWMQACCKLFKIPCQHAREWLEPRIIGREAEPTRTPIIGDGNCMFRAISRVIAGNQVSYVTTCMLCNNQRV